MAQLARAAVSKTAGWGFESLLTCNHKFDIFMKEKIIKFFEDVVKEMKKVTWPTKEELKESTNVVIIVCLIIAVFTYLIDMAITFLFQGLF